MWKFSFFFTVFSVIGILGGYGFVENPNSEHLEHIPAEGELVVEELHRPLKCEQKAAFGDKMVVHYVGKIHESSSAGNPGEIFDTTRRFNRPFHFYLGKGEVIQAWDDGLLGMCIGEKRRIIAPPHYAYGDHGFRSKGKIPINIPPRATLDFEVELMSFDEKKPHPNIFSQMDENQDGHVVYDEMVAWFTTKHPQKLASIPHGVWERDDINQDGKITWEEFTGPKGGKELPDYIRDIRRKESGEEDVWEEEDL